MRIVISGSSGLIGSALVTRLRKDGHDVVRLVRRASDDPATSPWRPYEGHIDREVIEGSDAVIHLSGANIAGGPWTSSRRETLRESRVVTSRLLAETIAACRRGPSVFVQASATGYYGHRPDEDLTEQSPAGSGFLADLCVDWENAARAAMEAGRRVVFMRTGLVLTEEGGLLGVLGLPFKLGLGAKIGSGQQYMSWLTLGDMVDMYCFVLEQEGVSGPVNCVTPNAVTNGDFTKSVAKALGRPTFLSVPAFPLRLVMGDMADELLLASQKVLPVVLTDSGYRFRHPELSGALRSVFG